jgi:DNA-binding FadR family transcriptional regulator
MPTEMILRNLYDGMELLLLMVCDRLSTGGEHGSPPSRSIAADGDVIKLTWQLFDAIARASDHRVLHEMIRNTNDRLAPVRRAKQGLLPRSHQEYIELSTFWQARNIPALREAVREYHERRKRLVPRIVALLNDLRDRRY